MLELAISLHDRVRVDSERLDHLFERGQLVPGMHPTKHHVAAHLLDQLSIDGHTGPRVDAEQGSSLPGA
jgi:hypothetical protein